MMIFLIITSLFLYGVLTCKSLKPVVVLLSLEILLLLVVIENIYNRKYMIILLKNSFINCDLTIKSYFSYIQ